MPDFWLSSGYRLLAHDQDGNLRVTDDFLRSYLARPELAPVPESCAAELRLHDALMADPRRVVEADALAGVADADARENYGIWLRFRDRLVAARRSRRRISDSSTATAWTCRRSSSRS